VFALAIPPLWMEIVRPFPPSQVPMQFHWLVQLILFAINVLLKYFTETQEKQKLLDTFSQFVPPEIVTVLNHQSKQQALEGESRYLTVFFCDLRNFTAMSEQLDPREVVRLLNEYFTTMTTILYKYGATIDKYIGDSVMAFWGAPVPQDDHYKRAVLASFEMHKQMESLRGIFLARGLPAPTIGIGINSGLMNVGNMGSRYRLAYTVIGDAVNLAARLQSATRHYKVDTIVGENTAKLYPDMVFRELDTVALKGKTQSTHIYEPLCERRQLTPELEEKLARHQVALDAWYEGKLGLARERFSDLQKLYPEDAYYTYMLERCNGGSGSNGVSPQVPS
jgi:adenylate cyclase